MKAHPLNFYVWQKAAKTIVWSCTLLLLLLPVLYRPEGEGVLPEELCERAQFSQPLTALVREGEALGSKPITWENEHY